MITGLIIEFIRKYPEILVRRNPRPGLKFEAIKMTHFFKLHEMHEDKAQSRVYIWYHNQLADCLLEMFTDLYEQ